MSNRHRLLAFLLLLLLTFSPFSYKNAQAEIILMPINRAVPTQPVTKLEIIALIKTILNGRVLSVKKKSSYTNPDCHHVKFLEDEGEFQMIKVGCFTQNIVQIQ